MIGATYENLPPWVIQALTQLGEREIRGPRDNPAIRAYHAETAAGEAPDEVAWCSSFVNWCFARVQLRGTRSKAASSWRTWGVPSPLRIGAVGFFGKADPDAKGTGHVFLVLGWDDDWVWGLGGNQKNMVSVARRPRSALETCRWPAGVP